MKNFEVIPLWPIPLYRGNLGPLKKEIKDFLLSLDLEPYDGTDGPRTNNTSYSVNKYVLNIPELQELKDKVMEHVNFFVYDFLDAEHNMEFGLENSWLNVNGPGDYTDMHYHGNSLICGCLYIDVNEKSGSFIVAKDKEYTNLFNQTVRVDFKQSDKLSIYTSSIFPVQPKNHDILLWPNHLNHGVNPNESNANRISLAFNLFPRGTAGGPINRLTV